MKILLAIDGSPYTARMLSYLGAHGELLGPQHEYTAITVAAPIPRHAANFVDHAVLDDYYREQCEAALKPVRAFAEQQRWKLDVISTHGHAPEVIAAEADKGRYDLLVMGSHGQSAVANLVLGSVATRVLAQCKTPVLLIR